MNKSKFRTTDSGLSFLVGQLEKLDPKFHKPLYSTSWARDVDLRSDISLGIEQTSFLRSNFAGGGTLNASGIPWISSKTTTIEGVALNGEKVSQQVRIAAREVAYTTIELAKAAELGQSIETMQINALNDLYQLNTDQMVYVGAAEVGATGLLNSPQVGVTALPNGASGSPLWKNKTPAEILADWNAMLMAAWTATGYTIAPSAVRLPPAQFGYLNATMLNAGTSVSIMKFLMENSIANEINGGMLDVKPLKWLTGRGAGGTDRALVYSRNEDFVRFPLVPMQRQTSYVLGIRALTPYVWAYGELEVIRPETMSYVDGL